MFWYEGPVMINETAIVQARRTLGQRLTACRQAAGLKQEDLALLVAYSRSTVANVETGRQRGGRAFWQRCDDALRADGGLVAAYEATEAELQRGKLDTAA